MQISGTAKPSTTTTEIPGALRNTVATVGHGPAIAVYLGTGRQEQGMASLMQWAAKGAHLIELELGLEPGERIRLESPSSWVSAAVCLAAWWSGVVITLDDAEPTDTYVAHDDRIAVAAGGEGLTIAPQYVLGDGIDGAPVRSGNAEPWVWAVQVFPDQPPAPRATPDSPALLAGGRMWTQSELLDAARELGSGTIGFEAGRSLTAAELIALAVRPLVTGRVSVVLRGVGRETAAGEKVAQWL